MSCMCSFMSCIDAEPMSMQIGSINATAVYHPLLLEPCLEPLKEPPSTEEINYDDPTAANATPTGSSAAESTGKADWEPQPSFRQTGMANGREKGKLPCPLDLLIPAGIKVVAVTGPNTGGLCFCRCS